MVENSNNSVAPHLLCASASIPICPLFKVSAAGRDAPVLKTGVASFAVCEGGEGTEIIVRAPSELSGATVRPLSLGLEAELRGDSAHIRLKKPANIWVDMKPKTAPPKRWPDLFVFAHGPETDRPDPADPSVQYFGGGKVHDVGLVTLSDGQTLYIEQGAIVRGGVYASGASNVTIRGHGVLSHSPHLGILLDGCKNATVRDITMIHPSAWMVVLCACVGVEVDNLREIGEVVSSDGIDIVGSRNVHVQNCFLRNNDDCVVVKAHPLDGTRTPPRFEGRQNSSNILVEHCAFWNDQAGNVMEIGFETQTDLMENITFRDIDVLAAHGQGAVFSIHNGDRAEVRKVLWEDIRVEHFYDKLVDFRVMRSRYSKDAVRGTIRDITLRNVQTIPDEYNTISLIGGHDPAHPIENVRFENCRIGDKKVTDADALHLFTGNARGITFQ